MSDPFLGEIVIFAGNFAPRGWAFCDGQLLPISQNTALFSLLGTTFGGDGRTTLALPNLGGRAPMGDGRGPGLSDRRLGARVGTEEVSLSAVHIPPHAHGLRGAQEDADTSAPTGAALGIADEKAYGAPGTSVALHADAVGPQGGGQPHDNMQPFVTLNFIIALQGLYPSRS